VSVWLFCDVLRPECQIFDRSIRKITPKNPVRRKEALLRNSGKQACSPKSGEEGVQHSVVPTQGKHAADNRESEEASAGEVCLIADIADPAV